MYIYMIFLAISLSIDSLSIGFAYGIKNITIPLVPKLFMSIMLIIYAWVAIFLGRLLHTALPEYAGNLIGAAILGIVGVYMLINAAVTDAEAYDADHSKSINLKESFFMGIALSIDSIGAGFGLGMTGLFSFTLPIIIGFFQFLFLSIGLYGGGKFLKLKILNKKVIPFLPGILMIILMLARLFA